MPTTTRIGTLLAAGLVLVVLGFAVGCKEQPSMSSRALSGTGASSPDGGSTGPTGGDVTCPPNAFIVAPLTTAWWQSAPPSQCVQSSTHDQPQLFDDCGHAGWNPACGAPPPVGAWECEGSYYSLHCLKDGDCPQGWSCALWDYPPDANGGTCQKTCTGTTPNECIRCDLACRGGICTTAPPPLGPPCTQDCECTGKWLGVCNAGHCDPGATVVATGFCGEDCPCNGGSCGSTDAGRIPACCYLPDGRIAGPGDPACQPAVGGCSTVGLPRR
jgi:hypothetical protein